MQSSSVQIPFDPALRPVRLLVGALVCCFLALTNGLLLAVTETLQTAGLALREVAQLGFERRWVRAVLALLKGLVETLLAGPAPLFSNLLIGIGAALELVKQAWDSEDPHFELVVGGGENMSFCSRTHDVVTRAEAVKIGVHTRYPVIESVELVSPSFLFDTPDDDELADASPVLMAPTMMTPLRTLEPEYATTSLVDNLKRFATD